MKKSEYIEELCGLFLKVKNQEQVLALLKDLLTPDEIKTIVERVQIFKMLKKGIPQRKISQDLGISISKVTRGSHAYKISKSIVTQLPQKA